MCDWLFLDDLGAISQIFAAIFTGVVVWQTRKTIDISERAERLQVFMDFSKAYDEIKSKIHFELFESEKIDFLNHVFRPEDIIKVLELIKLFERQHFLFFETEMVDTKLWEIWEKGIHKNMKMPLFKNVWENRNLYPEGRALSPRFIKYLENDVYKDSA